MGVLSQQFGNMVFVNKKLKADFKLLPKFCKKLAGVSMFYEKYLFATIIGCLHSVFIGKLAILSNKMAEQKHIAAVRRGLLLNMPLVVIGDYGTGSSLMYINCGSVHSS